MKRFSDDPFGMRALVSLLLIWSLCCCLGNSSAHATAYTWNNSVSNLWGTPENWTPNGIPGSADTISVPSGTVDLGAISRTVQKISVSSASLVNGTLVVTSTASTVAAGSFIGCNLTINSGATLSLMGGYLGGTVNNNGTVTWSGTNPASNVGMNAGAIFNNNVGAVFNSPADAVWFNNSSGSQVFNNKGTFNKTGSATNSRFAPGINFNNTGTANATSGTLELSDGTSTGTFNDVSPGKILFSAGVHNLGTGAKFTGNSSTDITGIVSLSGNVVGGSSGGVLKLVGGQLTSVAAGGTITGTVSLAGGYLGGTINVASGATATWSGSGPSANIGMLDGAVFNVSAGGIFNSQADAVWYNNTSGTQVFNVKGTLNRSGAGTSEFNAGIAFNNTGIASCTAGILQIADGTSSGTFNSVLPGQIQVVESTHTLTGGAKCTGTGAFAVLGGNVSINGSIVGGQSGGSLKLQGGVLTSPVGGGTITGTVTLAGGYVAGTLNVGSGATATWSGSGPSGNIGMLAGAVFNVNVGGTFNAQADSTWFNNTSGSQTFNVKGTLSKSVAATTSTFAPGVNFNNTGIVKSQTGTLALSDGTSSGTFDVTSGAFLLFNTGTHTLTNDGTNAAGAKFTGTGASQATGGVLSIKSNIIGGSGTGKLELKGGTLAGATGGGSVTGTLQLSGGYLSGAITMASGSTATWAGSGPSANVGMQSGSVFTVDTGANFSAVADSTWFNNSSGSQLLTLKGTLTKTGASTTSTFAPGINLNNTGTVTATSGTLALSDGTSSGTFNAVNPGSIVFNTGAHTLSSGAKFTGTGSTDMIGGTVTLNGSIVGGTGGGTFRLKGGFLTTVAGGGSVTGTLTLEGGYMGGTLTISSGGKANWVGSGASSNIATSTNAIFNVNSGAVFNSLGSAVWYNNGAGGQIFNMLGTMNLAGPGTTTIGVKYVSGANSLLNVRVGGTTAGTQYDQLVLTGPAVTLGGALDVGLINNFVPAASAGFQVVTFSGMRSGTFNYVSSPFVATYNANDVTIATPATATLFVKANPETFAENSANGTVVGTVTRSGAKTASLVVTLTNSNTARLTVPASVTIAANSASANFAISTVNNTAVDGNAVATITGTATGLASGSTKVNLLDDDVAQLTVTTNLSSFAENSADGTVTGTITRNTSTAAALSVLLTSNNSSKVKVSTTALPSPAASVTVSIPAGSATGTFSVHAIDNAVKDGNATVVLTATASTFANGTKSLTVIDNDNGTLTVTINSPTSVVENASASGAVATTGKVTLQAVSATPVVVTLTSANANKATFSGATVDNSTNPPKATGQVTIPANTLSANFNIYAVNNQIVDGSVNVLISANATNYATGSATLTVTDNDIPVLTLTVAPSTFAENGGNSAATATITRNTTNNAAALTVTLLSGNADKVTFASAVVNSSVTPRTSSVNVTIPAGAASVNVLVRAVNNSLVDGNLGVGLSATASGFVGSSAGVTVTDDEVNNMIKAPSGGSS